MYSTMKHVVLDQIRTAVLGDRIEKHVEKYFEAGNVAEALRERLFPNKDFLTFIILLVQTNSIDGIADQTRADVIGSISIAAPANKDATVAAQSRVEQGALACTISEGSGEDSSKGCKSH